MIRTNGQNGQRGRHEICGNHCKASRWVCMFDSKYTDYKVVNTTYGKDIIKEWVDAFKEAGGLKVGSTIRLLTGITPDFTIDRIHPLRPGSNEEYAKLNEGRDMNRYRKFLKIRLLSC